MSQITPLKVLGNGRAALTRVAIRATGGPPMNECGPGLPFQRAVGYSRRRLHSCWLRPVRAASVIPAVPTTGQGEETMARRAPAVPMAGPLHRGPDPGPEAHGASQLQSSVDDVRAILGNTIADKIANDPVYAADLPDAKHRWFPPLASPREGSVITDAAWTTGDQIAQAVGQYVFDNFRRSPSAPRPGPRSTPARRPGCAPWRRPRGAGR